MSGATFSKWSLPPHVITLLFDVIQQMVSPSLMEKRQDINSVQRSHGLGPQNHRTLWNTQPVLKLLNRLGSFSDCIGSCKKPLTKLLKLIIFQRVADPV